MANNLPSSITAYHTGALNLEGNMFSVKHLGGGEGLAYLGPGTYFITHKSIAEGYAKYHKEAALYVCKIDTSKVYDPFKGQPVSFRGILDNMLNQVLQESGKEKAPYHDALKFGVNEIGAIHHLLGANGAVEKFKEAGLSGFCQEIGPNVFELSIFDYSTVKIIDKEQVKFKEKVLPETLFDNYTKGASVFLQDLKPGDLYMEIEPPFEIVRKVLTVNEQGITNIRIATKEGFSKLDKEPNLIRAKMLPLFKDIEFFRATYNPISASAMLEKYNEFYKLASLLYI